MPKQVTAEKRKIRRKAYDGFLFLVQGYLIKALAVENGIALKARFL